jgi:two-component system response regulator DegU
MIRIMLVDDHTILRKGLRTLLELENDFEIVSEADSVENAIKILASKLSVDVVITDINMPQTSGLELIRHIANNCPLVKSIVLSMHFQSTYAIQAMELGAKGYVSKDTDDIEIIKAIRSVYQGEVFFAKTVAEEMAKVLFAERSNESNKKVKLSDREQEILKSIVDGLSNKMIAEHLHISESTVNSHRYNIMKKLNAKNSADLVRIALFHGLIVQNESTSI